MDIVEESLGTVPHRLQLPFIWSSRKAADQAYREHGSDILLASDERFKAPTKISPVISLCSGVLSSPSTVRLLHDSFTLFIAIMNPPAVGGIPPLAILPAPYGHDSHDNADQAD